MFFFLDLIFSLYLPCVRASLTETSRTGRQIYRGPRRSLARLSKKTKPNIRVYFCSCAILWPDRGITGVKSTWVIPLFSHVARLIRENAWHGAASITWISRVNLLICDEGSEVSLEAKSASEKRMALNLSAEEIHWQDSQFDECKSWSGFSFNLFCCLFVSGTYRLFQKLGEVTVALLKKLDFASCTTQKGKMEHCWRKLLLAFIHDMS